MTSAHELERDITEVVHYNWATEIRDYKANSDPGYRILHILHKLYRLAQFAGMESEVAEYEKLMDELTEPDDAIYDECEHTPPCLLADGSDTPCGRSMQDDRDYTECQEDAERAGLTIHSTPKL